MLLELVVFLFINPPTRCLQMSRAFPVDFLRLKNGEAPPMAGNSGSGSSVLYRNRVMSEPHSPPPPGYPFPNEVKMPQEPSMSSSSSASDVAGQPPPEEPPPPAPPVAQMIYICSINLCPPCFFRINAEGTAPAGPNRWNLAICDVCRQLNPWLNHP